MNAPATPAAVVAAAKLELLPLTRLAPSRTHIQELRRARFDKKALQELADSFRQVGVLQPLVARPMGGVGGMFEIVAGERRFLAAGLARLATVPVNISALTDEQVLEVQLIENLQREGLHELEEAEGYEELMKLKKINAEAVADMVGKSRSYVYARTKLIALGADGRKAFYAGTLDSSRALLIARIPNHEIQARALHDILTGGEDVENEKGRWVPGPMTYRGAQEHIRQRYTANLKKAIFDVKDAALLPKAGDCLKCPKRSGNMKELETETRNPDVCTDPKCFDDKRQAHIDVDRRRLAGAGHRVLSAAEVKQAFPWFDKTGSTSLDDRYIELDQSTYVGGRSRKVAEVLGADYKPILIHRPDTGLVMKVATKQAVAAAAGKSAPRSGGSGYNYGAAQARAKAKGPDVDEQEMAELVRLIHENAPKKFGMQHLRAIARRIFQIVNPRRYGLEGMKAAWKWKSLSHSYYSPKLPDEALKLGERDLLLFVLDILFVGCYAMERKPILGLFGISEKKVRENVIEARRQAQAAAREAKSLPAQKIPAGESAFKPSIGLAGVIGKHPITREEALKRVRAHIEKNKLHVKDKIKLDAKLKKALGKVLSSIAAFELKEMVNAQLTLTSGTAAKVLKQIASRVAKSKGKKK